MLSVNVGKFLVSNAVGAISGTGVNALFRVNSAASKRNFETIKQHYTDGFVEGYKKISGKNISSDFEVDEVVNALKFKFPWQQVGFESLIHGVLGIAFNAMSVSDRESAKEMGTFGSPEDRRTFLQNVAKGFIVLGQGNALISLPITTQEKIFADALEKITQEPKFLKEITELGEKDGKAMALNNQAQQNRNKSRERISEIFSALQAPVGDRLLDSVPAAELQGFTSLGTNLAAGYSTAKLLSSPEEGHSNYNEPASENSETQAQ